VINEVDQLRIEIEAHEITEQVKDEDLDAWNANIVTQIAKGDQSVEILKEWLNSRKTVRETYEREEQIKFEETKAKFKAEYEGIKTVLPNLIAKRQIFKRNYLN
jgi:ketol-acid reductoisomerase